MNIGVLYAIVAFVCCFVIIMIRFRVKSISSGNVKQETLSKLLIFFIIFSAIDGIWGIFFSNTIVKNYYCLVIFTYAFHFGAALSAFMWSDYMQDYLELEHGWQRNTINGIRYVILLSQIILLAQNLVNHNVFSITRDCIYEPTPFRDVTFYIQFSYYIFILGYAVSCLLTNFADKEKRKLFTTTIFFSSIPFLFGIGQMYFSDAPFYSMGFMITCIAIYGFNVTEEREKFLFQFHQKEKNKLDSIVEALSGDYEAIYYVDLETNNYQNFTKDSIYQEKIAPLLKPEEDFFDDIKINIQQVIYPDDRQFILNVLKKENLLNEFKTKKSVSYNYRVLIEGMPYYYQMKCVYSKKENDSDKLIIGVYDIDSQVHEQQKTLEIINAVGESFESIYAVNLEKDTFETFRRSDYLRNNYNDMGLSFSKSIEQYAKKDVHPDYRADLIKHTDVTYIKQILQDRNSFEFSFYDIHTGEELYYEMRVVKPKKYSIDKKVIIGFINRNDLVIGKQRETFITGLSDDYDSVFYGSLTDNTIDTIRATDSFRARHPTYYEKMTYTNFYNAAIEYVLPDDKEFVKEQLSPDNIRNMLNEKKAFFISYRQFIDGKVRYYRIKIIKTDNWKAKQEFMIGTSNVDELIRNQLELKEEDHRKSQILKTMADSYDSICYINLKDNSYIPYIGSTNVQKWYRGNSYLEDFSNYVNDSVLPEYRFPLIAAVEIEKLKYYRDNKNNDSNNANNNAFFTMQFQDNHTGDPKFYELSLLKVDESHIISAIQDRDYAIRKENEQRKILADAKQKAEDASKAKTTFLFNMSHDIRTPMNAIKGFVELAERNVDDKPKVTEYLSKVKTSSDHLLHLINDVLDMSRIESGKVVIDEAPANLKEATEKLYTIIKVAADEKNITLTKEFINITENYIYADLLRLNQIMMNILSNAVKYTKPDGKINYSIEQLKQKNPDEKISYLFTVSDNGIGMSKDYLDHIFEEFSRESTYTKTKIEGTGLGMSIVKRLVDMMNGKIEIDTELGKGTTVRIYLSFRKAETPEELTTSSHSQETQKNILKGKRLLLVEDNEFNREIAHEILSEEGLIIDEAEDGSIAVEKVKSKAPDYYDFILMDVQMPYMDGYQATKAIRSLTDADYTKLPIIAMTANAFDEDKKNALDAGMNGHLSKPIDTKLLIQTLQDFGIK